MAKPFHPGNSARAGIIAAMLAQKGMTANLDAVEGRFGYFDVYGNGQADLAGVSQNLGESFAIADGIQIKPWPTCGGNHVAISLLEEMWAEHGVRADDIASVEVTISQNPADIAPNIADPKTGFQGKFSLWYNIAAWILDGQINLNSFTDRRARRPQLRDLMNRVSVTQHEDYKAMPTGTTRDARFNEIAIHMKDGTVLSHRMEAARRLEGEEVLDKYRDNARLAGMGRAQIDRAIQLVQALEEVEDVNSLVDCTVAQVNAGID
jgi:2-methylcitrate dehydratase PrpD